MAYLDKLEPFRAGLIVASYKSREVVASRQLLVSYALCVMPLCTSCCTCGDDALAIVVGELQGSWLTLADQHA
jgi:hypothetical protein